MFKKFPLISRLLMLIVLPIMVGAFVLRWYLVASLPVYDGELAINGIKDNINISFDEHGLPSIKATNDSDAYFAQGYLHASERMWQMELQRRLVQGRLSEVFGKPTLGTDSWMRTLGIDIAAESSLASLRPSARQALQSYAAGVNAWIRSNEVLPPEFIALGITPEAWKPQDSLAWQKAFALNLGKNMYDELNRTKALSVLSPEKLKTFYPYDPEITEGLIAKLAANESLSLVSSSDTFLSLHSLEKNLNSWGLMERFAGSNGWVVSGELSKNGFPILANDPHLSIKSPSLWYALNMQGDKLNVTGMSVIGLPGVMLGRNEDIAWGATSLIADQQDLFQLDIPLTNNDAYSTSDGLKPISYRTETIHVRTQSPEIMHDPVPPVRIKVRTTELGPIITDALNSNMPPMALRWAALDPDDKSYQALYDLQYAQSWQQFRGALSQLKAPGFYFLYADNQGNIGGQAAAAIPDRPESSGVLPQDATQNALYWNGYVPFEKLPKTYNPDSGYVVSANNQLDSELGVSISHEWAEPYRKDRIVERINQVLNSGDKFDTEIFRKIQLDTIDLSAQSLLPVLLRASQRSLISEQSSGSVKNLAEQALDSLANWQGDYAKDSSAASIYHYWLEALKQSLIIRHIQAPWSPPLEADVRQRLTPLISATQVRKVLNGELQDWCDDINACQTIAAESLFVALKQLTKDMRSDEIEDWQWGKLHYVSYQHQPFSQVKLLEPLFTQRLAKLGSDQTINVANAVRNEDGGFEQTFGVTFRQIFDLSNDSGLYILDTGQSGHFLNDHYDDMMVQFNQGKLLSYKTTDNNNKQSRLQLVPMESN